MKCHSNIRAPAFYQCLPLTEFEHAISNVEREQNSYRATDYADGKGQSVSLSASNHTEIDNVEKLRCPVNEIQKNLILCNEATFRWDDNICLTHLLRGILEICLLYQMPVKLGE